MDKTKRVKKQQQNTWNHKYIFCTAIDTSRILLLYSEDDEDDEDEEEEEDSAAGGIFGLRKAAVGGDEDHSEEVRFEIR